MSYIDTDTVNQYGYKPNFILVNSPTKSTFFGDIIPVYKVTQELTSIVITSWESLSEFILYGQNFLVCVLSFLNQAINNTAYQSYLIINFAYQQVLEFPSILGDYTKQIETAFHTISQESTRELWWLEVKLDVRTLLDKVVKNVESIWFVLQKFYLAGFVLLCLAFLNFSTPILASTNSNSFLAKFLNNHSYISQSSLLASPNFAVTTNLNTSTSAVVIPTVSAYTVKEGDTIDKISESFGVKADTICFNNYGKLDNCVVKAGDKMYIPWVDGYIYNAVAETTANDLVSIYGVSKEEITSFNNFSYNPTSDSFSKDTLVLIPSTDFAKIAEANKKEQERKDAVVKSAEQAARNKNLQTKSIQRTNAKPDLNYMKNGFIWPTVGFISRCVQPGHIACDIANFNSPAIVASKSGVVTKTGYDAGGYGNHIIIDHGKDEKGKSIKTLYAHLASISISKGQSVTQGQKIGVMGATGYSTGIHLHYECIVDNVKQNPLEVCLP